MATDTPDILADYRQWAAAQPERISTHSDRCHMWSRHERCMIHRLAAALQRTRDELVSATRHMELAEAAWLRETAGNSPAAVVLTDAERECLEWCMSWCAGLHAKNHATLLGLLSRSGKIGTETQAGAAN